MISIRLAADDPEAISVVAGWHWEEWGHHDPEGSLASWEAGLRERTNRDRVPAMFLAYRADRPVGSAVLVEHDMSTRLDLRPWLAGVYVVPELRGQGIASALCRHAADAARSFGESRLYLYTNGAEPLYEHLGWQPLGREPYEGRTVTVMELALTGAAG